MNNVAEPDRFREYLTEKGLRATEQRLAIFTAATRLQEHFTAEELLVQAREIDDSVSRATVYRTLPLMIGSSILREVDIGSGEKYYRAHLGNARSHLAQVVCIDCERIFEVDAPFLEWYGNSVSGRLSLTPVSQRLQVRAHCDILRQTGTCPRRT